MPPPQLLICERASRWAIAWRRTLGEATPLGETRSLAQVDDRLRDQPRLPVAVDATAFAAEALLAAIARWCEGGAPVIVLASPALAEQELVFREAGAVQLVRSPRDLRPAARLIRRHLRRLPAEPASNQPLEQAVFARLPWARCACNGE